MIWWTSSASNIQAKDGASGDNWKIRPINNTKAGNLLVLKLTYPHGLTPTITDGNGNSWPGSPSVTVDGGVGNLMTTVWVLPNANAGYTLPNVSFGSNITPFFYEYGEFSNVATSSPVNGTHTAANQSGSTIAAGSFTPTTNNDAGGGNLILAFFDESANSGEACGTVWTPSGSFSLLSGDIAGGTSQPGYPHAAMSLVQSAQAAVNPTIAPTGATGNSFNCCAIALKAANAGAARSDGIYVRKLLHGSQSNPPATNWNMQCGQTTGNLWVASVNLGDAITNVTDSSDGFATGWTKEGSGGGSSGSCGVWYREGVSPQSNLTIKVTGAPQVGTSGSIRFFDIEGAAASGALAQTKATAAGDSTAITVLNNAPSITPVAGAVGGLCIVALALGQGPSYGFTTGSPSGAFFDLVNFDTQTDLSTMDNSDGVGHYYVPSTTALNFNWSIKNIPTSTGFDAVAVIFKGG